MWLKRLIVSIMMLTSLSGVLIHSFSIRAASTDINEIAASDVPLIYVLPIMNITARFNATFTVSVKIKDVQNLYGFDIIFKWNSSLLNYVSHSIRVPKDTYPDGVLYSPALEVTNYVNATAGTCQVAYASLHPASSFNGTGVFFNITLRAREEVSTCYLGFSSTDLADKPPPGHNSEPISHTIRGTWVYIIPPDITGDVDGDRDVDIYDVVAVCAAYGARKGDPQYKPNLDQVYDEVINIYDVVAVCANYGKRL